MNTNRKNGNAFERELCKILADNGFWVHNMAQNAQGQPFDVLAVKNGHPYGIDCKLCEHDTFSLDRIESNQDSAMRKWQDCGNGKGWFAIKISTGSIWMLSLPAIDKFKINLIDAKLKKSLTWPIITTIGMSLEEWLCVYASGTD